MRCLCGFVFFETRKLYPHLLSGSIKLSLDVPSKSDRGEMNHSSLYFQKPIGTMLYECLSFRGNT